MAALDQLLTSVYVLFAVNGFNCRWQHFPGDFLYAFELFKIHREFKFFECESC